jgi:anti-sigma regulatory factor (Ser/Thr protein kinase)
MLASHRHTASFGREGAAWVGGLPRLSASAHASQAHTSYRHEAFHYAGEDAFLRGTVPFVQDGVAAGQPVMVALVPDRLGLLRRAVGEQCAERVHWVDMAELGGNPARIIPAWRAFVAESGAGGRPLRGVGEPVWAGRRPAEVNECQLHESLLNLAVEPDTALWLRCPYDVSALSAEVVEEAARSHPVLVDGDRYRGSTLYGGAAHAADMFERPLPEPDLHPDTVDGATVTRLEEWSFRRTTQAHPPEAARDIARLRRKVLRRATDAGLSTERAFEMGLATTEAMTNSVRHAGGRGVLRIWQDAEGLTCEVRDGGHIDDPMAGRRMPPSSDTGGRGLLLVHLLSDLVQVRSSADEGSTVRITNWL